MLCHSKLSGLHAFQNIDISMSKEDEVKIRKMHCDGMRHW